MTVNTASARYEGLGKDGKGHIWTKRGALDAEPYGFASRFEDGPGTNPEELIAAAHAGCFTMALSFALAREGFTGGTIDTKAGTRMSGEVGSIPNFTRRGAPDDIDFSSIFSSSFSLTRSCKPDVMIFNWRCTSSCDI